VNKRSIAVLATSAAAIFSAAYDVRAAAPAEAGIAWCEAVEVASGRGQQGRWQQNESQYDYVDDPTVALSGSGAAAVAWVDQRRKDVLFQVYEPNGKARLKQPVNVSRSPQVFSWLPRLALSARHPHHVFILWQEIVFSGGSHGGDMFFARSRDGGASFEAPVDLSRSMGGDGKGRINKDVWHNGSFDLAISPDGALYAVWTEYDGALWFTRSRDGGGRFSRPVQITMAGDPHPARAPSLAVGTAGRVYLAWTVGENDAADVRLARSDNHGKTFSPGKIVAHTRGYSDAPKIALDSKGTLHLVHSESAAGPFDRYDIAYTRSTDGGHTFEPLRTVSSAQPQGIVSSAFPALSIDDKDNVFVLWELYSDPRERPRGLALAVSRDRGNSFSLPAPVPDSRDPSGGVNGSLQGLLMRKLATAGAGSIALVNSSFRANVGSHIWLKRGALSPGAGC
jgi:hypothetical protein